MKIPFILVIVFVCYSQIDCQVNFKKLVEKIKKLPFHTYRHQNLKFDFKNCGPDTDPMRVLSLSVKPDPLKLPGNITFSGEAFFKDNVTGPLTMSLKLIKVVGPFKVEIPCIDNFGSCTYADVCTMLPNPSDCPSFFKEHSIPCTCPFPAGDYKASDITVELDIPDKIPPGGYSILANFQNKILGHVGCVQIDLNAG